MESSYFDDDNLKHLLGGIDIPDDFNEEPKHFELQHGLTNESSIEEVKEVVSEIFWICYLFCSKKITGIKGNENLTAIKKDLAPFQECIDSTLNYLENLLNSYTFNSLTEKHFIDFMLKAGKLLFLLSDEHFYNKHGGVIFNSSITKLLEILFQYIKNKDILELESFKSELEDFRIELKKSNKDEEAKADIRLNKKEIKKNSLFACIAAGVIYNTYAHYKQENKDYIEAFLANVKAAKLLDNSAWLLLSKDLEAFDLLPCCNRWYLFYEDSEIQKTIIMWEQAKQHLFEPQIWDELEYVLRELDDIAWEFGAMDYGISDIYGKWYHEDSYFKEQYGFCKAGSKASRSIQENRSLTASPSEIKTDEPYSNMLKLRNMLRSCEKYIWWVDNYFNIRGLEELFSCLDPAIIREVRILSGPAKIDDKAKRDFERFRRELAPKGITAEWRIAKGFAHDRFIISDNLCYIAASVDTILAGNYSQMLQTPKRPPFNSWWATAVPISEYRLESKK